MRSTRQQARFAGLLYIMMCVTGLPGLLFIPNALIVNGDAVATANHLRDSPNLLRLGIASELFHQVVFAYLALALYDLFRSVNRSAAIQLVLLVALSVPIMFVNTLNELAALWLVPFGVLVMRSGFLPRALGVLLLAGAAGAMIGALTSVLPTLSNRVVDMAGQILALGELPIIVWLVYPGAREPSARVPASE